MGHCCGYCLKMARVLVAVCTLLVLLDSASCVKPSVAEAQQNAHSVRRRSDDLNYLEILVHQQAQVLAQLQSEVAQLKEARNKTVAFSVTFSTQYVTVASGGVLKFDVAQTNIGGGFNTHTGVFTAPYDGVYVFIFNFMISNDNGSMQVKIVKGNHTLALAHASSKDSQYNKGMADATTHLQAGDKVWVRHAAYDHHMYGKAWTTFNGFLLHAD